MPLIIVIRDGDVNIIRPEGIWLYFLFVQGMWGEEVVKMDKNIPFFIMKRMCLLAY